jgi:voltage-gated potassium channel
VAAETPSSKPEPQQFTPKQQRRLAFLVTYEAKTTDLLSALALVYLFTYTAQSIWYTPGARWFLYLELFGYLLWLLFAIDLFFRFIVDPRKKSFFKRNLLDTITVVIPQLRALRALRAFTANGILSKGKTGSVITGGGIATGVIAVLIIVWVGGLMVLNVERGAPGAEIVNLEDAVWWAFETITTVGYGDFVPVTLLGRIFAVGIMFVGISVLSLVTAAVAASLARRRQGENDPNQEVLDQIRELRSLVTSLKDEIALKQHDEKSGNT